MTDPTMRVGLHLPNFGAFAHPAVTARLAAAAEAAGWEGVFVWDHVVRREGDLDVADPWVLLAAMATTTTTVALGPLVTPLPRRRPWNVARAAVSIDQLSQGRMVLGVGLGTVRGPEFAAFGEEEDLRLRGDQLDESLAIIRGAWTGQPVDHQGRHFRVDGMRFLPAPVRPGGIPVWAATESLRGRAVRRAATLDGVMPIGVKPADIGALMTEIRHHRPEERADEPFDVVVAGTDGPDAWRGSGATWWLRVLPWEDPVEVAMALVERGPR